MTKRSTPETRHDERLQETLDRLRLELAEAQTARRRLVFAADADRHRIERDLHREVQQRLVALAVDLQGAISLADANPAAKALLEQIARDVRQSLDAAAQLAERIYPPLLEARGLGPALRSAAVRAGMRASVDLDASSTNAPELARTVYFCWLEALEHPGDGARPTLTLREEGGALAFEIAGVDADSTGGFDVLRDRVEALGGRLIIRPEPGHGIHVSGSLPLSR